MLKYKLNIWDANENDNKALSLVIPIVIYHGKPNWNTKQFLEYFNVVDEPLIRFIPDFDYILMDLSKYSDEDIKEMFKQVSMITAFLILKHIFNIKILRNNLVEYLKISKPYFLKEKGLKFFKIIVIYLYKASKLKKDEIINAANNVSTEGGKIAMTAAEQLKREGKIEAAKVMHQKGFSIEDIIDITKLTKKELEKAGIKLN